jgi:hypothetical protein
MEVHLLQFFMGSYGEFIGNIALNGECCSPNAGKKARCYLLPLLCNIVPERLGSAIRNKNERKVPRLEMKK